jgi:hypothetical protein
MDPPIGPENPPIGLYALILTAVCDPLMLRDPLTDQLKIERAFMAYLPKGVFVMPNDFKHDHYWKQLGQFTAMLQTRVSKRRWKEILGSLASIADEKAAADDDEDSDDMPSLSVLSAYRAGICVPESPAKF